MNISILAKNIIKLKIVYLSDVLYYRPVQAYKYFSCS